MRQNSFISMALAALLLVSCTRTPVEDRDAVQVPLSFLLRDPSSSQTKTTDVMAQSGSQEGTFRGITQITFLPFARQGAVQAGDERLGYCEPLEAISRYNTNHTVLYEKKWLPRNAASFLFYGKAPDGDVSSIWRTGSLQVSGLDGETPAEIRFAPTPIFTGTPSTAVRDKLVNYLTNLANCSVTQVAGVATFANTYPTEYAYLTNGGQLMAGTSIGIKNTLDVIYTAITKKAASDLKTKILNAILSNGVTRDAQNGIPLPSTLANYPGESLPSGSAALRWNGNKFVLGDDASLYMPAPNRYCYPLPLWYYANTQIRTTEKKSNTYSVLNNLYIQATTTWEDVLDQYENNPGKVREETTGAVLSTPIQYGMAQLALTLEKGTTRSLKDANGTDVRIDNDKYPVTALIIGGQRVQDFNFTPLTGSDDYLVYDNQFTESAYLSQTKVEATLRSLVLETSYSVPVYLAVELQNRSSNAFMGATGWVLPGAKFYLTGKLDLSDADNEGNGKIFERSCLTQARVYVSTLKYAYNVIPDLRDPQLQLSLTIKISWDFNTPANTPLK